MEEKTNGYRMTENVNNIVSLFLSKSFVKLEGQLREKDLNAVATLLDEPIFLSRGKFSNKYFERGILLDFKTVRDKYFKLFKEALYSINKGDLRTSDAGDKPWLFNICLEGFSDHIKSNYYCFYPYSPEYIQQEIEWKCEHIMESHSRDSYDENESCGVFYAMIDEETIWLANTYTKDFINELTKQLSDFYELDEDSGLSHNGVDGIIIDTEDGVVQFYTWHTDDEPDSEYIRWDLYYSAHNDKDIYVLD